MSPASPRSVSALGAVLGLLVTALGVTVLVGWVLGVEALTSILPDLASMKPTTAVCFVLVGLGVVVRRPAPAVGMLLVVAAVAGLSMLALATSTGLGVDWLFVHHRPVTDEHGRMALGTAICMLFLALAGLARRGRRPVVSEVCAAVAFAGAWTACLGYLYGSSALYQIGAFSTVALHTAIGLAAASVASLAAVRNGILAWTLSGRDAGALMMRRILPIALLVLPALGSIQLLGRRYHWFEYAFATALTIGACALVLLVAVGVTARKLRRADLTRTQAETSLLSINANLEAKISERSQALAQERARTEVFRERDRIAADLHDNVVQILFAAGLQLDLLQTKVASADQAARIATSVDDIHAAIAALRGSIFELKNPGAPTNLRASLSSLTVRAGRLMSSAPTLSVVGPAEDVPIDVALALLAVCQEALANVARHAGAEHCQVEVRVEPRSVTLVVTDDGSGMPPVLPHSSGIENITTRAAALGGAVRWEAGLPRGTRLVWSVPTTVPELSPVP